MFNGMILVIGPSSGAEKCATALAGALGQQVDTANAVQPAVALARTKEYTAVVMDQQMLDREASGVEALFRHSGRAVPVLVNMAISSADRVLREVRSALQRRDREQAAALDAAARTLRTELKGDITGILLSSQLALNDPGLPATAQARLRSVCTLAEKMRARLEA
jgi:DNA-binding NtrC family response regulator